MYCVCFYQKLYGRKGQKVHTIGVYVHFFAKKGTPMNKHCMLFCLLMSFPLCSMLDETRRLFVQSYEQAPSIVYDGGLTQTLHCNNKKGLLVAGAAAGLCSWDCATHAPKHRLSIGSVNVLDCDPDEEILYYTAGGGVFSWDMESKHLLAYNAPATAAASNAQKKKLYLSVGKRLVELNLDDKQDEKDLCVTSRRVSALSYNKKDDIPYLGLENGSLIKPGMMEPHGSGVVVAGFYDQQAAKIYIQKINWHSLVVCDAELKEDPQYIKICKRPFHITSFSWDPTARLLCATTADSYNGYGNYNVHIISPDNKDIRHTIPIEQKANSITFDSLRGGIYVGLWDKIAVLKPKNFYLALINSSAYTVFKMLLHINKQAALEDEWI